jgi:hypothetical protein
MHFFSWSSIQIKKINKYRVSKFDAIKKLSLNLQWLKYVHKI